MLFIALSGLLFFSASTYADDENYSPLDSPSFFEGLNTFTAVFPDPGIQAVEIFSHNKTEMVKVGWGVIDLCACKPMDETTDACEFSLVVVESASSIPLAFI